MGGRFINDSGASRREGVKARLELERRHCEERSDEAIHSFLPWQDGLLRFARNDGLLWLFRKLNTNAPHSQPSSSAKAGDPVFRGVSDGDEKPQRTGYSAFAEYGLREE